MTPQIKRPGAKLKEKTLVVFEKRHDLQLPKAYRAFLLQHNGGTPEPSSYCRKGKKQPTEVCRYFFGIEGGRSYADMAEALENCFGGNEPRIPRRLLPIAEDPFGNLICLSIRGKDSGKIYFWHHEDELDQKRTKAGDVDDAAISLIADSFDAFLTQFAEDEDDPNAKENRRSWYDLIAAGELAGVKAWLEAGGDINGSDANFNTPILVAVKEEQHEIVDLLLDRGLEPVKALEQAANDANWLLMKRIVQRAKTKRGLIHDFVFQMALNHCDDVSVIEALLDAGAPLHATLQRGNALYHATDDVADPSIVRLLLKRGVEPGAPGYLGRLPLSNAICRGKLETVKLLMDAGENLYFQPSGASQGGLGPLELLNLPDKRIKGIKAAVLAHATKIGQTSENTDPRTKQKG